MICTFNFKITLLVCVKKLKLFYEKRGSFLYIYIDSNEVAKYDEAPVLPCCITLQFETLHVVNDFIL